ncbi:MAG: ribonuclease H family protein [Bacteroidales bacterium]|nr:ribonuclease H family protein [Bacteroidales bacterium]
MSKNKFYVVWAGRTPGVYDSWEACKREVVGQKRALYKGFPDRTSADAAFARGFTGFEKDGAVPVVDLSQSKERPLSPAIAVDAACAGNPGKMEYQGVFVDFGVQPPMRSDLFKSPVFPHGTNNIGEFLAIVHAVSLQKKHGWHYPVYSDSVNAQLWVRQKKCKTKLQRNAKNAALFDLIERAEKWLNENTIEVPILKWKTEIWGEIPADFGRK